MIQGATARKRRNQNDTIVYTNCDTITYTRVEKQRNETGLNFK